MYFQNIWPKIKKYYKRSCKFEIT